MRLFLVKIFIMLSWQLIYRKIFNFKLKTRNIALDMCVGLQFYELLVISSVRSRFPDWRTFFKKKKNQITFNLYWSTIVNSCISSFLFTGHYAEKVKVYSTHLSITIRFLYYVHAQIIVARWGRCLLLTNTWAHLVFLSIQSGMNLYLFTAADMKTIFLCLSFSLG